MSCLNILIAEDEDLGRERLIQLLAREPDIKIGGIAVNGTEALRQIEDLKPDILFLDVRMPELDGFAILSRIDPVLRPVTVFVTAFEEYAVKAFEVHGTDYLLKPFSDARFKAALERAREYFRARAASNAAQANLLDQAGPTGAYLDQIAIRSGFREIFLDHSDIDWIEAQGVYVLIHSGVAAHLYRANIGEIEKRLDPKHFVRVHRSAIIRTDRIGKLRVDPLTRQVSIVLKNGTKVALSRGYKRILKGALAHRTNVSRDHSPARSGDHSDF